MRHDFLAHGLQERGAAQVARGALAGVAALAATAVGAPLRPCVLRRRLRVAGVAGRRRAGQLGGVGQLRRDDGSIRTSGIGVDDIAVDVVRALPRLPCIGASMAPLTKHQAVASTRVALPHPREARLQEGAPGRDRSRRPPHRVCAGAGRRGRGQRGRRRGARRSIWACANGTCAWSRATLRASRPSRSTTSGSVRERPATGSAGPRRVGRVGRARR